MRKPRGEEIWARACIASELRVPVERHDDGSSPGMHDLNICYTDCPPAAVEVTGAADAESIELWNLVNGSGRWEVPDLDGGWAVEIEPTGRAKVLQVALPPFLRKLELAGIPEVDADHWNPGPVEQEALAMRIRHLSQHGTDFPGSIYVNFGANAGFVPDSGDALPEWIGPWLREPSHADNLAKLSRAGSGERHLFVFLPGFTAAPFVVEDLFMRKEPYLPDTAPDLPDGVTHLWVMSSWADGKGLRWGPDAGWKVFEKVGHGRPLGSEEPREQEET